MPLRSIASLVLLTLVAAASASAAPRAASGISPGLVHRGQKATISVRTSTASRCMALLRYSNGRVQSPPAKKPRNHKVSFVFKIPADAAVGAGHWSVVCGHAVSAGSFVVAGVKSTTSTEAPRVVVDRQGFSQRNDKTGPGSLLSYGLVLHDTSETQDAENVYVIVNMVAATGELIGSKSRIVPLVPAGGTYNLGDSLNLRTQFPVASLEITIRVGAHEPKQTHVMPDFANVRYLPSPYDPGWVAEVDGEILNMNTPKTLTSARLSLVVLDAAGTPLGGGTGFTLAAVPFGSRFVFVASSGFTAIPLDKAASVLISAEPSYQAPSS